MDTNTQPKTIVVTVVLSEGHFSHSVTADGRTIEGTALGLALSGPVSLAVTHGAEKVAQAISLARQVSNLAGTLHDSALHSLLQATEGLLAGPQDSVTEQNES